MIMIEVDTMVDTARIDEKEGETFSPVGLDEFGLTKMGILVTNDLPYQQ
jgi:hypothetical protein